MSVTDKGVIDFMSIDPATGHAVLTISDHLDWSDESQHLAQLQEKINDYIAFIESGEIFESYPKAKGRDLRVDIVGEHEQTALAKRFMAKASQVFEGLGVSLSFRQFSRDQDAP